MGIALILFGIFGVSYTWHYDHRTAATLDEYARLDNIAQPELIEPKGYVFVGGSRQRLSMDCMPSFKEIVEFADQLGPEVGMELIRQREDSRVVLLGHQGQELDVRKINQLN